MLERLVARFESGMPQPRLMWEPPNDPDFVHQARARAPSASASPRPKVVAKRKLSQNRPDEVIETIIAELEAGGEPVRRSAARRRDAARPRRPEGRAVTPRSRRVRRRHRERAAHRRRAHRSRSATTPSTSTSPTGVIVDIAPAGALPRRGRGARRRRRRGLIPGLWDHHVHVVQWALAAQRAPLGGGDVRGRGGRDHGRRAGARRTAAASAPDSATRSGRTRRRSRCSTPRPATCRPISINADVHSVWLNTAALRREGFEPDASGILREEPAFEISRRLNAVDAAVVGSARRRRWRRMPRPAVSSGSSTSTWRGTRTPGHAASRPDSTSSASSSASTRSSSIARSPRACAPAIPLRGAASDLARVGRAQGHHRRVARHPHGRLLARLSRRPAQPRAAHGRSATLVELMTRATGGGHRLGHPRDRRRRELARARRVRRDRRVGHDRARAARRARRHPAVRAPGRRRRACSPSTRIDDRDITDAIWAGQTAQPYPLRALADTGANLLFGSDAPVSPLDPWAAMAAAVFRTRDGREPWQPQQRVDAATALAASTHGGSAARRPHRAGRRRRPGAVRARSAHRRPRPSCAAMTVARDAARRAPDAPVVRQPPRRTGD